MKGFLSLEEAVGALKAGEVIIFPTETYYGLGCNAFDPDATGRVFMMKNRPMDMPLPVVIGQKEDLSLLTGEVSPEAAKLMEMFWPGPLSIVFPALPQVPDLITANVGRVAVRLSPHKAAQELCRASGMVLVASSANVSGESPVSDIEGLSPALTEACAGIFDAGPRPQGFLPSTVVDIIEDNDGTHIRILRPGAITAKDLQKTGISVQD